MKHTIINRIAALLLLAVGLAGCSKEELSATGDDAPQGTPLTISVTDGGYASASADGARTRAVENGYATQFTAGDKIGLYVVKPDGTYAAEKVCLTLTDVGGKPTWQAPAGTTLYYEGVAAKYFAYYPYQSELNGTLAPSTADAASFFADVTSQWSPTTDQSTHAKYTACDLMIGSGSISKQGGTLSLSFTMTHAMALVVIETPTTKYTFTNSSPSIPDYYISALNTKFNGFTPYNPTLGVYRYLVKPTQSGANDLIGSYTGANGNTKEYTLTQNGLAAAKYACYKVDGGSANVVAKTHNLQAGDFYMKDGSLVGKDVELTAGQRDACLGIVFKVGRDNSGKWKDNCTYKLKDGITPMSTIHGYVLALYDANDGGTCTWGSGGTLVGTDIKWEDFDGYNNTNLIKQNAKNRSLTLANAFPATYWATDGYESKYPAPVQSCGWLLPSVNQCHYWRENEDKFINSIKKALNNPYYTWDNISRWTSSERDVAPHWDAWTVNVFDHSIYWPSKDSQNRVRSILVF